MVIVAETIQSSDGLGEAVAGVLMRANVRPPAFRQIGLPDAFLDAGALRPCMTATASRPA